MQLSERVEHHGFGSHGDPKPLFLIYKDQVFHCVYFEVRGVDHIIIYSYHGGMLVSIKGLNHTPEEIENAARDEFRNFLVELDEAGDLAFWLSVKPKNLREFARERAAARSASRSGTEANLRGVDTI